MGSCTVNQIIQEAEAEGYQVSGWSRLHGEKEGSKGEGVEGGEEEEERVVEAGGVETVYDGISNQGNVRAFSSARPIRRESAGFYFLLSFPKCL